MARKVLIVEENSTVPFDPRVWKEALSLNQNGYQVTVLAPRDKRGKLGHHVIDGVHIYTHPTPNEGSTLFGHLLEFASALFWEVLFTWWIYFRRGFDVIQGCNPPDTIFLVALPFKLFGVKYIFDHHDASPELYLSKYDKKGFLYRVLVWLEKQTFHFSDVVMATNNSYRDLAISRGGVEQKNVFVVRNGPEKTFKPVTPNPALKCGKSFLIGYVGNMNTQDGLDLLLDVASNLKNSGRNDIHFRLVGGGPSLPDLRRMTKEKGLEEMVTFTGRISDPDMLESLSTSDVCVNPDKPCKMNDISTMIKIMEYMALGKPIVQFRSTEGRHSAMEASLYADGDDPVADFSKKIAWLLDNPEERKKMGESGRRRVESELAWEYSVPNLLAAYERAFSMRRR